jgi:hypothetical protein
MSQWMADEQQNRLAQFAKDSVPRYAHNMLLESHIYELHQLIILH